MGISESVIKFNNNNNNNNNNNIYYIMKARESVESLDQNLAETIAQSVDNKMNLLFT